MTLGPGSSLEDVALAVAISLKSAGIRAILTGGACAGIHTGGLYTSSDLDFVVPEREERASVGQALAALGFFRTGNTYSHPAVEFVIEFLPGPLAIGADMNVRPAVVRVPGGVITGLSATDSCRDRLAAWYHWNDPDGLRVAVLIAARRRVDMKKIEAWSRDEGHQPKCELFRASLARHKKVAPGS